MFTCTPHVLWRAEFLAARAPNHLAFEPRPDVAPLLRIMDEYERYAVALVDKTCARLFSVFMGEIEESDALRDTDAVGRTDQGGWSQARYQRPRGRRARPGAHGALRQLLPSDPTAS